VNTLFIDIASHNGLLACVTGESVVAGAAADHRIRDDELMVVQRGLLQRAEWTYGDVERIACIIGPGGFTSLRVAVTFANVLADQLGIPLAGARLWEMYEARRTGSGRPQHQSDPEPVQARFGAGARYGAQREAGSIWWLHSAKRDSLFVKGGKWEEPTFVPLEDFLAETRHPAGGALPYWCGELLPEHERAIGASGLMSVELAPTERILPLFLGGIVYGQKPLVPWYGRGY